MFLVMFVVRTLFLTTNHVKYSGSRSHIRGRFWEEIPIRSEDFSPQKKQD
jgi:hypothetical protein